MNEDDTQPEIYLTITFRGMAFALATAMAVSYIGDKIDAFMQGKAVESVIEPDASHDQPAHKVGNVMAAPSR